MIFSAYLMDERREARSEGRMEGLLEGRMEGTILAAISQIRKKLIKQLNIEDISDMLELEIDFVKQIVSVIQDNPEWTDEEIYTHWYEITSADKAE